MKITVLCIGKTDKTYILTGMAEYQKRLKHFVKIDWQELPDVKNRKGLSSEKYLEQEEILFLKRIAPADIVYLLDENGEEYTSVGFAGFLKKRMNAGISNLVFLIGGPYGFSRDMHRLAKGEISLSKMTFTHQMVRLFFLEQLYRAFSILRNMPYHHK